MLAVLFPCAAKSVRELHERKVVAEHGADGVNVGKIARRAEVHETSIYRRWPTKEHLVLDALLTHRALDEQAIAQLVDLLLAGLVG
jgi:AcrR family transcriptional regulator